jgi:hydroxyacylglutathione hydrolase
MSRRVAWMRPPATRRLRWAIVWLTGGLLALLWFAPVLYFETLVWTQAEVPQVGPRPEVSSGRWIDDYFLVESLDDHTFAIGEPRYYQGNYSYLLIGSERALLFDAGSGLRDITSIVRALTSMPVTVLPSHLHFDHVGALGRFERTALPDSAQLRARLVAGEITLTRYEYLGALDRHAPPRFRVDEWWRDGQVVDLGGRTVTILHTPGHTPTSVSVWEPQFDRLYVGDFLYPGELYAFLPGASLAAYEQTSRRLLGLLPVDVKLYAAHMQEAPAAAQAPVMGYADLQSLLSALEERSAHPLQIQIRYPQVYPVRGPMTLATGFPWNVR